MIDIDSLLEGGDLYQTRFPEGWKFTWRLLTLKQHRVFDSLRRAGTMHDWLLYRMVFDKCVIAPKLLNDRLPMGVIVSIGEMIMYLSGDCNKDTIVHDITQIRLEYVGDDIIEFMKRITLLAFPSMDWLQLENTDRVDLIRLFVQAEAMMAQKTDGAYKPIDLAKIVRGGETAATPSKPKQPLLNKVNFEADNAELTQQLHPYDIEEANEPRPGKLSPAMARKLDRATKQRP